MSSYESFCAVINGEVERFATIKVISKIDSGRVSLVDYHRVLLGLFHQVKNSSSSFSLAAATCPDDMYDVKSYLMHHAEEEKLHWQWILDDLAASGYQGPSPLTLRPHWTSAAYVAYNYYVAARWPIGRLGIAMMLETVASRLGEVLALRMCKALDLKASQATFFLSHAVTDKQHEADLGSVLRAANLKASDWEELAHHASVAGELYRQIYEELG